MLKDITIGQYFPGNSVIHRMDPRMKLILVILFIVLLFLPSGFMGLVVGILITLCGYLLSGISLTLVQKSLRPVIPIIVFTALLNMLFVVGEPIFTLWVITITREGLAMAVLMAVRIICLIAGTSLLTYTTSPIALTDAIELLLWPLTRLGVPVHELAMMMTIALRFIPTLIEETDKIMSAQKARGADLESGGFIKRAKALIPILIPLFVSAFRRADELALAMECRCYRGGEGRTRLRQLRYAARDFLGLAVLVLACALVLVFNRMFPPLI